MMVQCKAFLGGIKEVSKEKLSFRPSVYGIVLHGGKMLVVQTKHTHRYALPGGGVEIGEPVEEALRRELREETGVEIQELQFQIFREEFFYYDPSGDAFHSLLFFYRCRPVTLKTCSDEQVDDGEVEKPGWVEVQGLRAEDFHSHGEIVMQILASMV